MIETSVGKYIRQNYKAAVEIGFGGKTVAAEILQNAKIPILCTDVHSYENLIVPSVVDDVFSPTLAYYKGAEVIYAIRPGIEILPPMILLAEKIHADLLVYHLGFELYENGGEKIFTDGIILHRYVKRISTT